ncbi:unnamed protein product [Paramecium primaurelia]|uniref:Uncharacterized protein n=1 Tax=Paramecium primaurelia TaxID=5886 RepID=A0A8S1Q878_PARPR|nr:unnamed protein product [Paramecium primaurelia]
MNHSLENVLNAFLIIHHKCVDTSVLYMTESEKKQSSKIQFINIKIQDTHNSNKDAKIAFSLAKLSIEIMDHILNILFTQQQTNTPDVLIQLKNLGRIHLIESKLEMKRMVELLQQRNTNAINPKLIFEQIQYNFEEFQSSFQTINNLAPSQTIFKWSIGGHQQQFMFIIK